MITIFTGILLGVVGGPIVLVVIDMPAGRLEITLSLPQILSYLPVEIWFFSRPSSQIRQFSSTPMHSFTKFLTYLKFPFHIQTTAELSFQKRSTVALGVGRPSATEIMEPDYGIPAPFTLQALR